MIKTFFSRELLKRLQLLITITPSALHEGNRLLSPFPYTRHLADGAKALGGLHQSLVGALFLPPLSFTLGTAQLY